MIIVVQTFMRSCLFLNQHRILMNEITQPYHFPHQRPTKHKSQFKTGTPIRQIAKPVLVKPKPRIKTNRMGKIDWESFPTRTNSTRTLYNEICCFAYSIKPGFVLLYIPVLLKNERPS